MQSKWILQVICKILSSQKTEHEDVIRSLQEFLPADAASIEFGVLSPALAKSLHVWHILCNASSGHVDPNLETVLVDASKSLTSPLLQTYYRPLARLSTTTHFKRLLNSCHTLVVSAKVEKDAVEKSKVVQALVKELEQKECVTLTSLEQNIRNVNFETIRHLLKD